VRRMRSQRALRALPTAGTAGGGVLLGHWLAYLAALPKASLRDAVLSSTGHGYWTEAVRLAVALGVCGLAALVTASLRTEAGPSDRMTFSALLLRLAPIQCAAFLTMETVERAPAHVPVASLLTVRVLVLGLAFQVLTAWVGARLLAWLDRAVGDIVAMLRTTRPRLAAPLRRRPRTSPVVLRSALVGAAGVRGPPEP